MNTLGGLSPPIVALTSAFSRPLAWPPPLWLPQDSEWTPPSPCGHAPLAAVGSLAKIILNLASTRDRGPGDVSCKELFSLAGSAFVHHAKVRWLSHGEMPHHRPLTSPSTSQESPETVIKMALPNTLYPNFSTIGKKFNNATTSIHKC